jgi:hypothetical protein
MKYVDVKGNVYYLHKKLVTLGWNGNTTKMNYFFKKTKEENECEMPEGYKVIETRSIPMIKRI